MPTKVRNGRGTRRVSRCCRGPYIIRVYSAADRFHSRTTCPLRTRHPPVCPHVRCTHLSSLKRCLRALTHSSVVVGNHSPARAQLQRETKQWGGPHESKIALPRRHSCAPLFRVPQSFNEFERLARLAKGSCKLCGAARARPDRASTARTRVLYDSTVGRAVTSGEMRCPCSKSAAPSNLLE